MATIKLAPLCAAVAITASGVFLIASPSAAADRPVVIEGSPPEGAIVQRVTYGDLNLASRDGEKLLYRRVGRAVGQVCNKANPGAPYTDLWTCRGMSWESARPQIATALDRARAMAARGESPVIAGAVLVAVKN
ncbi:UrcA family protein [Sphingomonas arenae]|uniref:UrcA family protein n=1 Tax=Sphingomonas arenae TaxID=2812555 RepID=UPI0019678203|nr:UrcA family protein [Sphingomonas arenae]